MSLSRRSFLAASAAALALPATRAAAATHQVVISGHAFSPADLTISAGDTVVFTNQDGAPHTATANNGAFDTQRLNRGQSAQLTINAAGTYEYICSFHRSMRGVIRVT